MTRKLLLSLLLLYPAAVSAELFKYKDETGRIHVVDSMDAIPEKYKKAVKSGSASAGSAEKELSGACKGKKLCGVIVLASHCPVCLSQQPRHKELLQKNAPGKELGLMAIVGFGQKPGQNEEFAKGLGDKGVVIDGDGSQARKLGINTYPRYLVMDENRKVVMRDDEASFWIDRNFGSAPVPPSGSEFLPPTGGPDGAAPPNAKAPPVNGNPPPAR